MKFGPMTHIHLLYVRTTIVRFHFRFWCIFCMVSFTRRVRIAGIRFWYAACNSVNRTCSTSTLYLGIKTCFYVFIPKSLFLPGLSTILFLNIGNPVNPYTVRSTCVANAQKIRINLAANSAASTFTLEMRGCVIVQQFSGPCICNYFHMTYMFVVGILHSLIQTRRKLRPLGTPLFLDAPFLLIFSSTHRYHHFRLLALKPICFNGSFPLAFCYKMIKSLRVSVLLTVLPNVRPTA